MPDVRPPGTDRIGLCSTNCTISTAAERTGTTTMGILINAPTRHREPGAPPVEANDASPDLTGALHIREVVRITGLRREQLYMWQRRYGFPAPLRDPFGDRVIRPTRWRASSSSSSSCPKAGVPVNGTYQENIILNKAINLVGEDKTITIIDGNSNQNVVNITSKNAKISGFTIQNSSKKLYSAGIVVRSEYLMNDANVTISDNIIQDNDFGVYLYTACSNTVKDNIIQNNNLGLYVFCSINNHIEKNIIQKNNVHGIIGEWSQNTFIGNMISDNKECGIYLRGASNEFPFSPLPHPAPCNS